MEEPTIVKAFKSDLENISSFITAECIKLAQSNGGVVDTNSKEFKELKHSMMNADPESKENEGKATLSFKATERGIEKKINKEIEKGADSKSFDEFREEMAAHRKGLDTKLSSNEGVIDLISDKLKKDALNESVSLTRNGDFLKYNEKKSLLIILEKTQNNYLLQLYI